MKKKPDPPAESKSYEGIQLYRDDIELILSIFHENEYTIQITDEEFLFDSLDELIDKRGIAPTYFEINGERKEKELESVRICFDKERIRINSYSFIYSQKICKVVFAQIRDICELRISKIYKILNQWFYFFPAMFLAVMFFSIVDSKGKERALSGYTWLLVLTIVFFTVAILSSLYRKLRRQVILKRKHEGGFWKQNSDKIWLLILGAVFGIFLKFILEVIWKAF
jgi:hypothetical protein